MSRAAATLHLHVGSRLPVGIWAPGPSGGLPPFYRKLDLTVTGIGLVSTQVVQDDIDSQRTTGAVPAVIVVAATLTFGSSLSYLISRPALYGWDFNYALYSTDGWGPFPAAQTTPLLRQDRDIAATTAALPALGDTLGIHPSLSTGAILPTGVVSTAALHEGGSDYGPNAILVRLRPGVSQAAGLRSLQQIAGAYNQLVHSAPIVAQLGPEALELMANVLPVQRPAEIVNYKSMGTMPVILANLVAALPGRAAARTSAALLLRAE